MLPKKVGVFCTKRPLEITPVLVMPPEKVEMGPIFKPRSNAPIIVPLLVMPPEKFETMDTDKAVALPEIVPLLVMPPANEETVMIKRGTFPRIVPLLVMPPVKVRP
jgi:hypothetical protein